MQMTKETGRISQLGIVHVEWVPMLSISWFVSGRNPNRVHSHDAMLHQVAWFCPILIILSQGVVMVSEEWTRGFPKPNNIQTNVT
ncbi:hypothetical protein GGR57DRAFT_287451 [Xylariaceae sp. FL1272]|nr:hypothetical protein GGR57DRAFT_287451 [Xylariaceae sp. FL1272]